MFGKRADGYLVRGLDPISKATPYFMPHRYDALNFSEQQIRVEAIDEYIKKQWTENGVSFSYMHVLMAAIIRLYALRPNLNRFIKNCRLYQRKDISVSITIKKSLTDEGEESLVKMHFKGNESIYDVKRIVDEQISQNVKQDTSNGSDKFAKLFGLVPGFMFRFGLWFLNLLDRWELLPGSLIEISPFHTGMYLTNLKSIKSDAIFHHIYDFGTCSLFIAMGKEKMVPVVNIDGGIESAKVMNLGVTMDERICDGFYLTKSIRLLRKILEDPSVLNDPLPESSVHTVLTRKERKQAKKLAKKQAKAEKKAKKQ